MDFSDHQPTDGYSALSGLTPDTRYYYRVFVETEGGTTEGGILSFVTPPLPPTAETILADVQSPTSAIINGAYNLHGAQMSQGYFEVSKNSNLSGSNQVPFTYDADNDASALLTGLTPNTKYYYRIVVENKGEDGIGGLAQGETKSFVTLPDFSFWDTTVLYSDPSSAQAWVAGQYFEYELVLPQP